MLELSLKNKIICQSVSNLDKPLAYFFYKVYSYSRGRVKSVIYPSIDKLLNLINSKYELVHIAASRSRDIKHNSNLQMPKDKYKSKKNIGKALEEIAQGMVTLKK